MSVTEAPPVVVLRLAVITDEEAEYRRLVECLTDRTEAAWQGEWLQAASAVKEAVDAVQHDAWIVDARRASGTGRRVLQELDRRAVTPLAVVVLVDVDEEFPNAEAVLERELTATSLRRALHRARRQCALRRELRQLRAERDARAVLQQQLLIDKERKEHLLQGIMQSLPLLLGRLDRRGRVVETHGAGLGRCGICPEVLMRRRLGFVLPQARQAVRQALQGQTTSFSLRGRHEGHEWHADFVLLPEAGPEDGVIFLGRDVSERRWLEQQLLTATDAEQQRIGADLHDGLGQQLTGLACLVAALRDRLQARDDAPLAAQADFIVEVANDATRQSRALARGLCPVQLEGNSLETALEDLVYQAQQLHGVQCHFRSRGEIPRFDHFTSIHLYRITQEALHNAVRHGLARNVWVTFVSRGSRYRLTIADDGRGFDSRQPAPIASRGLRLMNYRAGIIGGALSIITRPGRGTRILCQFAHASALHEDSS